MRHTLPALAVVTALAACTPPVPETGGDGYTRIEAASTFASEVVGRELTIENNRFTIAPDGTFAGEFGGTALSGTWVWSEDGYWCRTITEGASRPEDCQLIEIFGTALRATRDRGEGPSFVYQIN